MPSANYACGMSGTEISFREVDADNTKMILDWRTSPEVTKYMISDVPYDIEAQKKWIESLYDRPDYYLWVFLCDNIPAGCVHVEEFDFPARRTSWGIYKGAPGFPGAGARATALLYNWLFFTIGIEYISTTVFYENEKALELYLKFGHTLLPEKDRVIYKNGREMRLATLSLSVNDWDREKYAASAAAFPTSRWKHLPV